MSRLQAGRRPRPREDRRPWYRRGVGVWLVAGGIAAAILGFIAVLAVRGHPPRSTVTVASVAPLADGSLLVLERVADMAFDDDGGAVVTTTYRRRRLELATGAELARVTLRAPRRCAAAIEDLAWCWAEGADVELVDAALAPELSLAALAGGRYLPGLPSEGLLVDTAGRLLLRDGHGGWLRVDPRTHAVDASDGAADPGRRPARPAARFLVGGRWLELVPLVGTAERALRGSGVVVAVEAGAGLAPEPRYLTDGVLAAEDGAALTLDDDLLVVERDSTESASPRRLTRSTLTGERRWSATLPGAVAEVARAGERLVVVAEGELLVLDVATGARVARPASAP